MLTGLTISNGIGWSPDGTTMYLADSGTGRVDAFDFDATSGDISRRRTIVAIDEPGVAPDGLTVDEDGGDLGRVVGRRRCPSVRTRRHAADATVPLPVDRPTSCAFGGPDRSTLFVTTARHGLDDAALSRQPHAGHVFRIDGLGVTGRALRALPRTDHPMSVGEAVGTVRPGSQTVLLTLAADQFLMTLDSSVMNVSIAPSPRTSGPP